MPTVTNRGEFVPTDANRKRMCVPWVILGVVVAGCCALIWTGCSTPEQRYKVLSFFFDGVPDPSLMVAGGEGGAAPNERTRVRGVNYFVHKPVEDGACSECHTSFQNVYESALDSRICLKCHEPVTRQYPRMHGPVAAVACLFCHTAHDSQWPALLKERNRELCTQCHEPGLLLTNDPPAHLDPAQNCLDCHSGHGGTERGFLKPAAQGGDNEGPTSDAGSEGRSPGTASQDLQRQREGA